jgi:hypothetical protein
MMHRIGFILLVAVCLCACNKDIDKGGTTTPPGSARYAIDWAAAADSSTASLLANYWNASLIISTTATAAMLRFITGHRRMPGCIDRCPPAYRQRFVPRLYEQLVCRRARNAMEARSAMNFMMIWSGTRWPCCGRMRQRTMPNLKRLQKGCGHEIKGGWNETMGGGISWRKAMPYYKNTPANAPAAILAARLYKLSANPADLDWSKKIFTWLRDSLYNAQTGWVYDGINSNNDGVKNTTWKFTYNQGTFIGAALELYHHKRKPVPE